MLLQKLLLPSGGNETTLPPSSISFASTARAFIDSVKPNGWFGPGQPLKPNAPKDTLPRSFDYAFGANFYLMPRQEQPGSVSFGQLRAFADNCDLLRIIIQGRKAQIAKVPWSFKVKGRPGERYADIKKRNKLDPDVKLLTDFFKRPDREHGWDAWIGMVLEEIFVIDALSVWPVFDKFGKVVSMNLIDGATIKPLHDQQGWRPNPPNPSYQQIIKGMPAVNMTSGMCPKCKALRERGIDPKNVHVDEEGNRSGCNPLIYYPRNPRVNKFYGFSQVEWIVRTILLAINRQMSQIAYYTEGNIPEMIVQVPEAWNPDQIAKFQQYMDTSAGDLGKKRRMWFVPETKGITQTKDAMLKDEMDDWLARVICFSFGVSAQPLTKMMNRGTAQVASEAAAEEGTIPELNFISGLINYIIEYYFNIDTVEFAFNLTEESDGMKRMRIDKGYAESGLIGYDEIRDMRGLDPIGVGNMVRTAKGVVPLVPEGSHIDNLLEPDDVEDGKQVVGTQQDDLQA